jgi:hypothetical protein
MNTRLILIFLLVVSIAPCHAAENDSNFSFSTYDIGNHPIIPPSEQDLTGPIPYEEGDVFDEFDAGSDMVAKGVWDKGPTIAANEIYDTFGKTRGFIFSFITYNINPEKIPIAKNYNDQNQNLAIILAVLFMLGEGLTSSMAGVDYAAYKNVFGDKDFSQKPGIGGGLAMLAGISAAWIFRGLMIFIDLIDVYFMIQVMDAIKPSLDTGLMYFFMALIEVSLFGFFLYRQLLIGAMYIISPIFGVLWASGHLKEFVDSIGDKFIRALIMQPLCIFITVVSISLMEVMDWDVLGITIFEGNDSGIAYLFLTFFLVMACIWCLFSNFTIIKRVAKIAVFKKV